MSRTTQLAPETTTYATLEPTKKNQLGGVVIDDEMKEWVRQKCPHVKPESLPVRLERFKLFCAEHPTKYKHHRRAFANWLLKDEAEAIERGAPPAYPSTNGSNPPQWEKARNLASDHDDPLASELTRAVARRDEAGADAIIVAIERKYGGLH